MLKAQTVVLVRNCLRCDTLLYLNTCIPNSWVNRVWKLSTLTLVTRYEEAKPEISPECLYNSCSGRSSILTYSNYVAWPLLALSSLINRCTFWKASMDPSVQSICISLLLTFVLCGVGLGWLGFTWLPRLQSPHEPTRRMVGVAQAKSGHSNQLSNALVLLDVYHLVMTNIAMKNPL